VTTQKLFIAILIPLLFGANSLLAQSDIPFLTWRSHLSYTNILDITSSENELYVAAENALFFVDQEEFSINKITKVDGLSDVTIGAIHYDQNSELLIVGYANGNIDLIYSNEIVNISVIKDANLIGDKTINDIKINEDLIYLSSEQGIFVLDKDRKEIIESYLNLSNTGSTLPISELAFKGDSIYATTSEGLLSASLNSSTNRQDFNNWQRNLTNNSFSALVNTTNGLTASSGNILYNFDGTDWLVQDLGLSEPVRGLLFNNNSVFILTDSEINFVNGNVLENVTMLEGSDESTSFYQNSNGFWIGSSATGLVNFNNSRFQNFSPTGPGSDKVWQLYSFNNTIFTIAGGYSIIRQPLNRPGQIGSFLEGTWSNDRLTVNNAIIPDVVDLVVLENNRFGSNLFTASFQSGLINVATTISVIDENTPGSTLQRVNGRINMTSIAKEGKSLWMGTHGVQNSIHQWNLETDTWDSYSFGFSQSNFPVAIFPLANGDKWVALDANRGGGILVFNENSNLSRYLNTNGGQGGLPGREVTSMQLDQNNFLWVGTNAGIAFYPNAFNVLEGRSLSASIPIFENSFLLRDEFITSVAIDPGNRKWIGTATNGIWLFTETGEELVYHFTAENSPLLSNEIESIQVDAKTGEVFIGTSSGLVSFRSDAVEGNLVHTNVKVFPNPVTQNFNGVVTITGLVNFATVKITDVSGKLVRELKAQGSSAIWDARDYNGKRVQTGVYLIFSSNSDGTETYVSKIAVI